MEVHHHPHTSGPDSHRGQAKKWSHYFWEFLMLFLAVFCGFLAENIREHQVEHHREKQFMSSMLEDLKSDSGLLVFTSRYWDTINQSIDSVAEAIQFDGTAINEIKPYRFLNRAMDYYSFTYNDRTISQLKNSGGFRLIRNKEVASKIILFDQFNNDAMKNIAALHEDFYKTMMRLANKIFVQQIINKVYERNGFRSAGVDNNGWIDSLIEKNRNPLSPGDYRSLLFEFKNALLAYRRDYVNMKYGYDNLKQKISELMKMIESAYHLTLRV